ncbi:MAG: long-chain fatty aldehyde decarbonylase [Clostridia bacterium]|nr:long-chain fatty aldehyde decarbonylase [Clostridia bacterium]
MIRLFPKIEDDLFLALYHKARRSQWTSADVDWDAPLRLGDRQARALARILTPVYLGEQAAMLGAARVVPQLADAHETSAQLYVSTFLMDEARHFETLTKLYRTLGHDPIRLREMPESLRYHHRLVTGDRFDWVWGILISDIFSSLFYQTFARAQPDALFGRISTNILTDESRHKAFAHYYLRWAVPRLPEERREGLRQMKEELLQTMKAMYRHLQEDSKALGIDGDEFFERLTSHIETHARRIGIEGRGADPDDPDLGAAGSGEARPAAGGKPMPPGGWTQFFRMLLGLEPIPGALVGPGGRPLTAAQDAQERSAGREPRTSARRPGGWALGFKESARAAVTACAGCAVALLCRSRLVRSASGG